MTRIHLVDASPYIFRAYFSIPPSLTNPAGEPVNAVHGFGSFLLKAGRSTSRPDPEHEIVASPRPQQAVR